MNAVPIEPRIATQAKDGLNSVGIGAYFNVTDFGQMLMWHIVLMPVVVGALVVLHILMVRRRGVVPPLALRADAAPVSAEPAAEEEAAS
jgi:ubiquinol-cytochrome c reductase cytochrome b subunit